MDPDLNQLSGRAVALGSRFAELGAKLGSTARALLEAGAPADEALVNDLTALLGQFAALRNDVVAAARRVGVAAPTALDSLQSLDPLLAAINQAVEAHAHREALEQARAAVIKILDRAAWIVHLDDPAFAPLRECQQKAGQIRIALAAASEPMQVVALTEAMRGFTDLLALVEGRDKLDAERLAQAEDNVARALGQPIAAAAARGRLALPSAAQAPPPAAPRTVPPPGIQPGADRPAAAPRKAEPVRTRPAAVTAGATAARDSAGGDPSAVDETGQWWLAAWARWSGWKSSMSFQDAVRAELTKYPYLLSVPIRESTQYDEGLLAYGYSILVDHVERQSPGSVGGALNSLKTGTGRAAGDQLYDYLTAEGNLAQTYGEFVRDTLLAALPEPGVWFDTRIQDGKEDTRFFRRPTERIGDPEQAAQRKTADAQRFTDHRFTTTLPPLTSRFYLLTVEPKEARAVDVRLTADGAPSDAAWLVTLPAPGRSEAPDTRELASGGTTVSGLGREHGALWIAVFNADSSTRRRYELTLGLKKETRGAGRAR